MADTDISANLIRIPGNYSMEILDLQNAFDIDVLDPDFTGIETVGTHTLFQIPVGQGLKSLTVAVATTATSGGAATVQFLANGVALGAAPLALAELDQGAMVELPINDDGTHKTYAWDETEGNEIYVTMAVATAALTAGRFIIIPTYHDVASILSAEVDQNFLRNPNVG